MMRATKRARLLFSFDVFRIVLRTSPDSCVETAAAAYDYKFSSPYARRVRTTHSRRPRETSTQNLRDFDDLSRRIVRCCILGARPLVIGSDRARGVARKLMRFSAHSIFRDDKNSRLVEPRVAKPPIEATNTSATRISPSSTPSVDAMPRRARGVECGHDMDCACIKGNVKRWQVKDTTNPAEG